MIKDKNFQVFELREVDGEYYGALLGYFAEGHIDKQAFAIAVNQEFDLAGTGDGVVSVSDVLHLWFRKERDGEDCLEYFVYSQRARDGYAPITKSP